MLQNLNTPTLTGSQYKPVSKITRTIKYDERGRVVEEVTTTEYYHQAPYQYQQYGDNSGAYQHQYPFGQTAQNPSIQTAQYPFGQTIGQTTYTNTPQDLKRDLAQAVGEMTSTRPGDGVFKP